MAARRRKKAFRGWRVGGSVAAVWLGVLFVQAHPGWSAAIFAVLSVIGTAVLVVRRRRRVAAEAWQAELDRAIEVTDGMGGTEFELWTARLLGRSGCVDVEVVGGSGDLGADVTAIAPDGGRIVVQCKRHGTGNKVGSPALQRFSGTARAVHGAHHAVVVTTSTFTRPAQDFATAMGIVLVDRDALAEWARTGVAPIAFTPRPGGSVPSPGGWSARSRGR
ncbi:restriction endonuclease [Umezawaea sp. NPDC059074]|uniref:restriction endonuclease n=1 Tax=Umezawaea sp. NPDC059074 TaxID=3346716 RepID=UPI0036C8C415